MDFGFLCIEEEGTQFCLSSGCGGKFEDSAGNMNGSIQFYWVTVSQETAKEKVTAGTTLGMGC